MCGSCDIAFHFNVRYDESAVICNMVEHDCWGSEERKEHIPIKAGTFFELIFKAQYYGFQVSTNGHHLLEYSLRLPLTRVDTLKISGDVHVNTITFKNPNVVPYQAYIGSIRPQQLIKVIGTANINSHRFTVNLMASCSDNIALHINQRFDQDAVVRTSRIDTNWGVEERDVPFLPFVPGQTFELQIHVEPTCYKVLVNGRHLFNYNHRLQPLSQIDTLEVSGDVTLFLVQY
ncbi:galectin-9-like isoform X2 [Mobula hypostoma]|uniref:galectin-9-like isoform X2 n=1 Tax=Mobula hypostoma TaxID=723540 RepID=UPI002FC321F4